MCRAIAPWFRGTFQEQEACQLGEKIEECRSCMSDFLYCMGRSGGFVMVGGCHYDGVRLVECGHGVNRSGWL